MILPLLLPMCLTARCNNIKFHPLGRWHKSSLYQRRSPLSSCNHLRPISLTVVIMRLFDRLVYRYEISSICNDYIGLDQFAYREGHNSTMALIKCQHTWLKWLDGNDGFVRIFSFDFSKAFHSVSHNILCSKLKQVKINPCIIN